MNKRFFPTLNYKALTAAVNALINRDPSLPGLGLVYGQWGLGKSASIEYFYGQTDIYYVMAEALWSPRDMLQGICEEMNLLPEYRTVDRFNQICRELKKTGMPLFIDEADYLFKRRLMLDTIKDMHERTRVPIILVGMENICGKLQKYGQFWSRILPDGIVEFQPLTPPELTVIARDWCGLTLPPEASEALCRLSEADFRYLVGYLLSLEKACAVNESSEITLAMVETLARKQNRKKDASRRFGIPDRRLQVVGRELV
jgi:hypothetical protein